MKFQEFCLKFATDVDLNDVLDHDLTPSDLELPERYKMATETMVSMMKNKRNGFDRINVPFVEMVFDNGYEKMLEEKLPDGEIPESIIRTLAEGIFCDNNSSRLDVNQQAIIKVLATYICIQN